MITLVKLLITISIFLTGDYAETYQPTERGTLISVSSELVNNISDNPKKKAFHILENKCNTCHKKRHKRHVFSLEKMDAWADKVYKQVFMKNECQRAKNKTQCKGVSKFIYLDFIY